MFNGMGIQWASTLLGCVAAVLVPIPVLFYLYGHKLRAKSKFAPTPPPEPQSNAGLMGDASDDVSATDGEKDGPSGLTSGGPRPRKDLDKASEAV